MSFLNVLKTIGKDLALGASVAAPFVNMFAPGAGSAVGLVANLIIKAEQTYTGEKQGTAKKTMVMDEFTALLPLVNDALKEHNLQINISATDLSALIDATVAQFNAAKALHDTFKIVKTN